MSAFDPDQNPDTDLPAVRELSKPQRRVLGTLVEKAFTVPESYPMTLKGLTVGCNQKSNRDPVTSYTEDGTLDALDELRQLGLVAVVHTESGRTERYRHYVRKRFPFSEPQLAIVTELLLRGRQQMGELRARASRMVAIESLEDLRSEVEGLIQAGYVRANGSLERRGVEVDHSFYLPAENVTISSFASSSRGADRGDDEPASAGVSSSGQLSGGRVSTSVDSQKLETRIQELQSANQELREEVQELRGVVEELRDDLSSLRQSLGA